MKRIMVVDDEKEITEILGRLLRKKGYEVQAANNGQEALDMLGEFKPDIMLLDIMMPGIDGLEVCEIIKNDKNTRDVQVIMLTNMWRNPTLEKKISESKADGYMGKVGNLKEILEVLEFYINREVKKVPVRA